MFYFSLARELGMSVRQLLDNIDSRELTEWMVYSKLENDRITGKPAEADVTSKIKAAFTPLKSKDYVEYIKGQKKGKG